MGDEGSHLAVLRLLAIDLEAYFVDVEFLVASNFLLS